MLRIDAKEGDPFFCVLHSRKKWALSRSVNPRAPEPECGRQGSVAERDGGISIKRLASVELAGCSWFGDCLKAGQNTENTDGGRMGGKRHGPGAVSWGDRTDSRAAEIQVVLSL